MTPTPEPTPAIASDVRPHPVDAEDEQWQTRASLVADIDAFAEEFHARAGQDCPLHSGELADFLMACGWKGGIPFGDADRADLQVRIDRALELLDGLHERDCQDGDTEPGACRCAIGEACGWLTGELDRDRPPAVPDGAAVERAAYAIMLADQEHINEQFATPGVPLAPSLTIDQFRELIPTSAKCYREARAALDALARAGLLRATPMDDEAAIERAAQAAYDRFREQCLALIEQGTSLHEREFVGDVKAVTEFWHGVARAARTARGDA